MALAAREVHVAAEDDHAVVVERNIVVDPELGVAAKVENVAVAVDLGDGNVGIARQQKVVGIAMAPGAENTQATPAAGQYHHQGGYPSGYGYPQSAGYPPQHPQYPQQPAYPPAYPQNHQYGYPPADQPPPYPQQRIQQAQQPAQVATQNVVVIQQPQRVVQTVRPAGSSDYGSGAMVLAIGVTIFIVLFGCWWSLICSIAGIALASNASSAGIRGDYDTARSNSNASIGCSITGGVSTLVGIAIVIGIAVSGS